MRRWVSRFFAGAAVACATGFSFDSAVAGPWGWASGGSSSSGSSSSSSGGWGWASSGSSSSGSSSSGSSSSGGWSSSGSSSSGSSSSGSSSSSSSSGSSSSGSSSSSSGSSGGWGRRWRHHGHHDYVHHDHDAIHDGEVVGDVAAKTESSATFQVSVPEDARVWVNGALTAKKGTERSYIARHLIAGKSYTIKLKAEFAQDGRTVSQEKTFKIVAGKEETLAVAFPLSSEQGVVAQAAPTTRLKMHVPADAQVYLNGKSTKTTGEVREYATGKLAAGAAQRDFAVKVVIEREGRTLAQERRITLAAGENHELWFNEPSAVRTASAVE